jgi:hypothetical protein
MVQAATPALDVAHVIQLSVAPVFLLSGIGVTLGVLATRVGRIIDRARLLEQHHPDAPGGATPETPADELRVLARRAQLVNRAITLFTGAALLLCFLIASLFVGALLHLELIALLASLFIAAMLALIVGYLSFLREIFLATETLRFGRARHP